MVGLVDCNNFFVSCERVFNPALEGVPVVVLSGNDGCVIARSNEAKAMGIAMGEPFFKIRSLYKNGTLKVCSSNIRLYGDMSKRVMGILRSKTVKTEVYSIDEAFINLEGIPEPADYCRNLVKTIRRSTGIPVSIGIANTKTLAKMASKFAKQYPGYKGCCTIDSDERRTKALKLFPIGDVWGIGRQNKKALNLRGVSTAYDFTLWSEQKVRELLGITGVQRTFITNCRLCRNCGRTLAPPRLPGRTNRSLHTYRPLWRPGALLRQHCRHKVRSTYQRPARSHKGGSRVPH